MNFLRFFQSVPSTTLLGGRYKLIGQLGAGGFGQTFLAEDLHLPGHPRCVIKKLKPQFSSPQGLQTAKRLFDTEAKVLYQLGNHDQIPRLLAHFEHEQEFYLAQELIVGEPLSEEMSSGRQWKEEHVVALLQDILNVLAFVHQQGVIHRDIKPQNLIRRRHDSKIVLIDFGAVKQASIQLADPNSGPTRTISIGTQGYMPNEQVAGNPRFSSDIYAVGKIGIQALTGVAPKHLEEDPQTGEVQWRYLVPQITPELADVLDKMVKYDFRTRYSTATEALAALEQVPVQPVSPPVPSQPLLSEDSEISSTAVETTQPWKPKPAAPNAPGETIAPTASRPIDPTAAPPVSQSLQSASVGTPPPRPSRVPTETLPMPQAAESHSVTGTLRKYGFPALGLVAIAGILVALINPFGSQPEPQPSAEAPIASSPVEPSASASPEPDAAVESPSAEPSPSPNPTDRATELLTQADQFRQQGQFQQALERYEQVIALKPDLAEAQWGKCYILNRLLQPAEAIVACDAALALKPNYPEALWSKGYALDAQQQIQEALMLYEQAIALKPDFAEAWSNKGTALFKLGRFEEALAALNEATRLNPNLVEAWNSRGAVLWNLRRFDEAFASVERAIQIQPDYQDALTLREEMRRRLGR